MKTPRDYQIIAIERATRENLLIGDACGLGKTLEAIETVKRVQRAGAKPALIVAPSETVKLQWRNALIEQGIPESAIFWVDSKTPAPVIAAAIAGHLQNRVVVLTHYEAVRKHVDTLTRIDFAVIVADEAHRIKNRKALRTIALKALRADRKLALTGTPHDKNPADVWSILNWLYPDFFRSYWRFFDAHIAYDEIKLRSGQKVKSIRPQPLQDPERFARLMRQFSIARTKQDVRADLPPRNDIYVDLEMGAKQAATYDKVANAGDPVVVLDSAQGVETTVQIVLTQILREIQITTDPALVGLSGVSSVKLEWIADWIEDNPTESVIIFTRFRETAEKLAAQLEGFTLIVGGKRGKVDASVTRIVGTISAMGEGLDLPHIDNAIFIDVEWSSILMQQAIDRIHRININNAKNIYYLRCKDTTDELLHLAIRSKWRTKEIVNNYLSGKRENQ